MGKITNLLIGLVVVAFVFTGFVLYMSESSTNAGLVSFSDTQYLATYDKINEVNNLTDDIQSSSNTSVEQSSADILGSYFKQGYSAFRLTLTSGKIANDMLEASEKEMQLDGSSNFFNMIVAIIIIIVVFGVIIYVVVGKDV